MEAKAMKKKNCLW